MNAEILDTYRVLLIHPDYEYFWRVCIDGQSPPKYSYAEVVSRILTTNLLSLELRKPMRLSA